MHEVKIELEKGLSVVVKIEDEKYNQMNYGELIHYIVDKLEEKKA